MGCITYTQAVVDLSWPFDEHFPYFMCGLQLLVRMTYLSRSYSFRVFL